MSDTASAPFTDSYIVQCDRNSSMEADQGNNEDPSIFTNKQGTGLRLNAGDKVSVHSAFINEIGNTDGTIEFKGTTIKDSQGKEITYELEETTDTLSIPFPLDDLYSTKTDYPWTEAGSVAGDDVQWNWGQMTGQNKKQILQPYGHQRCDVVNTKKTFVMKDNEMNVQIGYYKCANGENYMHLPRRFDSFTSTSWADDNHGNITTRVSSRFEPDEDSLPYAYKGMQWSGCPVAQSAGEDEIGWGDGGWNGQPTMDIRVQSQVKDDWCFHDKGRRFKPEGLLSGSDGAGIGVAQSTLNVLGTDKRFRWKNDNSRYMLFKKERTFFTTARQFSEFLDPAQLGACLKPENLAGSNTNDFISHITAGATEGHEAEPVDATKDAHWWNPRDPACTGNWYPYYEIKNIQVEKGFKSPEDVADEISTSLNKTGEPEEIYARTGERTANVPNATHLGASHQLVGLKKDGEIFKSFYSTNHSHFNAGACKDYFVDSNDGTIGNAPEKEAGCARYMSAFHYVGVKRPSLWITGREFCQDAFEVSPTKTWGEILEFSLNSSRPGITKATRSASVCTSIPWSKRHLLNKFIQAQGEYPELFEYGYSNIKKTGSAFENDVNVSEDEFQMGNKNTGETYARYIHFDLTKSNGDTWKDSSNQFKGGDRRLGCDNYEHQGNTDFDLTTPETYTGYEMQPGVNPAISRPDGSSSNMSGQLPYYDLSSVPLWFWYDQTRADLDEGGNDLACSNDNLVYGCMKRYNPFREGDGMDDEDYIAFATDKIGGLPDFFFQKEGNPTDMTQATTLDQYNYIGYDRHFNAYGTKCIMPYSGYLNGTQPDGSQVAGKEATDFYYTAQPGATNVPLGWKPSATNCKLEQTYQYSLHTYIGANGLSLNYDNTKLKRFNWQGLHTPEYIGNNFNAGSDATDPKIDDASQQVYKINKRLSGCNYCPEMIPYNTDITTTAKDASNVDIGISSTNWNLEQWSAIFDAHSGITFENFGGTETNKRYWHKSLWGLLGFSYNQFNYQFETSGKSMNIKDRISFNSRVNADNQGQTPFLLTNAEVKSSDVSLYRNNIYGAGLFSDQGLSYGSVWHGGLYASAKVKADEKNYLQNNPAISVQSQSISLIAEAQPTKMLRPYYLIKSNIVGDMKYIGAGHSTEGGQMLPIIGVVNKENGFGDFYFQTSNTYQFTITQPRTLSEVITSIHDPDMSSARVDKNSAVLYLIQKQNNTNLNVVQTLLQENEINPEELEPPMMNDQEYNQYFQQFIMNPQQQQELNENMINRHYLQDPVVDLNPTLNISNIPMNQSAPAETRTARPSQFLSFADAKQTFEAERERSALGIRAGDTAERGGALPDTRSGAVVRTPATTEAPRRRSGWDRKPPESDPATSVSDPEPPSTK
jgi:hypothetical protein